MGTDKIAANAQPLRVMLDELAKHRAALMASELLHIVDRTDFQRSYLKSSWRARMKRAARDGVEESLLASIREEGWRAFAEGGLKAMYALADAACEDDNELAGILDHNWEGIGSEASGYWMA